MPSSHPQPEAANDDAQKPQAAPVESPENAESALEAAQAEAAKYKDQWLRAVADAENIRKRAERDQQETSKYAVSGFARDMVDVLENLMRALDSVPAERKQEHALLATLMEGVDLTKQELLQIFERHGIRRISPLNEKFDHHFHQAVVQIERPDLPSGTVVQVVQAGYVIGDRLLRPAMVAVSKQGDAPKQVDTSA